MIYQYVGLDSTIIEIIKKFKKEDIQYKYKDDEFKKTDYEPFKISSLYCEIEPEKMLKYIDDIENYYTKILILPRNKRIFAQLLKEDVNSIKEKYNLNSFKLDESSDIFKNILNDIFVNHKIKNCKLICIDNKIDVIDSEKLLYKNK